MPITSSPLLCFTPPPPLSLYFLVNPPCLLFAPHKPPPPPPARLSFLHAVCPFLPRWRAPLGFASAWISSMIPPVSLSAGVSSSIFTSHPPFPPHTFFFSYGAYQGLLTALAVRYLCCLRGRDILSSPRAACLTRTSVYLPLFGLSLERRYDPS